MKECSVKMAKGIKYSRWIKKFKPMKDPFGEIYLFDTCGPDADFVENYCKEHPNTLWTKCTFDEYTFIKSGFYRINRLGYYLAEIPCKDGEEFIIYDSPEVDFTPYVFPL